MAASTISVTERDCFVALRSFLTRVLGDDVPVVRGQVNRVPEPSSEDFVVMWPLGHSRLSSGYNYYSDNEFVGQISGVVLGVSEVRRGSVMIGSVLTDTSGRILEGTRVIEQLQPIVIPGGIGVYRVSRSQQFPSSLLDSLGNIVLDPEGVALATGIGTIYGGVRHDLVQTELRVQIDVHGPNSSNSAKVIEGLFRTEVAIYAFQETGLDVTPLYCEDPRQIPFINAEKQYENRWSIDAHLQFNPIIGTHQQFADRLEVTIDQADAIVRPPGPILVSGSGDMLLNQWGNPLQ